MLPGNAALTEGGDPANIAAYASGSASLGGFGAYRTLDIALDGVVNVRDECLYIALWCERGHGRWLDGKIDESFAADSAAYPNFMIAAGGQTFARADKRYVCALSLSLSPGASVPAASEERRERETAAELPLEALCPDGGYCNIFGSMVCIGDSLTAGVHEHNESGATEYPAMRDYSAPAYMARALGIPVRSLSAGGMTAKRFVALAEQEGYFKEAVADAYIIALGTNDIAAAENGRITGAIDDINLAEPSLTDASTDVGAYARIIQRIREASPKAKIFCVTVPHTRNADAQIAHANALIRGVAERLDCYVIDLERYGVQPAEEAAWKAVYYTGGHLNTLGYRQLAVWYMSYIDWIVRQNPGDFAQTAFIQTKYVYNKK